MSIIEKNITTCLFILLFTISSCARYIDTRKNYSKEPDKSGFFQLYPDSNIFKYKTNIVLTRDTERIYPKSFEVKLPKKIRYYEFIGSTDFAFYYDNKQVIFIKVELEHNNITQDTIYNPTKDQLEDFIESEVLTGKGKV